MDDGRVAEHADAHVLAFQVRHRAGPRDGRDERGAFGQRAVGVDVDEVPIQVLLEAAHIRLGSSAALDLACP